MDAFVAETRDRHNLGNLELSVAAHQALVVAAWPGNVRQLANALVGAAIRAHSENAPSIEPHHIFPDAPDTGPIAPWQFAIRECQRQMLSAALEATKGRATPRHRTLARLSAGHRPGAARRGLNQRVRVSKDVVRSTPRMTFAT